MQRIVTLLIGIISILLIPQLAFAGGGGGEVLNLHATAVPLAIVTPILFVFAYILVMSEEFIHLRKSKPVIVAAGIIWLIVAWLAQRQGMPDAAGAAVRHNILEYAELFMFLLVAMTYVNALEERLVFEALRAWLVRKGFSYRKLFWITGILAFFISPIADNLTTALLMCAVVMAVGADNPRFVSLGCINIVVAANAGGAFSPFGDITTLMVWQAGKLGFIEFFDIFVPSLVSYLIPAAIMTLAIPKVSPDPINETVIMKFGAKRIIILFLMTIVTAVCFHHFFHLPPVLGMMTGLGYLQFFGYYLKRTGIKREGHIPDFEPFDIFKKVGRAEWDTLFFFYGIILCVGGLAAIGYLHMVSNMMYNELGANLSAAQSATPANFLVGIFSAILDNIPVMFSVLTMDPTMSDGQWLLVTLTAGIGGSMLAVGSAAGVALMGQAKGKYTFFGHLKWSWAIFIGYAAAVACHIWMNAALF